MEFRISEETAALLKAYIAICNMLRNYDDALRIADPDAAHRELRNILATELFKEMRESIRAEDLFSKPIPAVNDDSGVSQ